MRLITGDECGLLKEVIPEYTRQDEASGLPSGIKRIGVNHEQQTRSRGVASFAFLQYRNKRKSSISSINDDADASFSFAALRKNGSLEIWNTSEAIPTESTKNYVGTPLLNYKPAKVLSNVFSTESKESTVYTGKPMALNSMQDKLVCCDTWGNISLISCAEYDDPKVIAQYDITSKKNGKKDQTKLDVQNEAGCKTKGDIFSAFALSDSGRGVIGGKDRATTMFDIETGKTIWKAKNLPPDPQTLLQEQIWSTSIQFLSDDSIPSIVQKNNNKFNTIRDDLLVVGTAYKQVHIFDIRTQRRPIVLTRDGVLEHRVTALCQLNQNQIVVGDTAGYMHMMDIRKIKDPVGRYTGPAGCVKEIVRHPSLPVLACVGYDRMLRTYDINTKKAIDKIYLKQRLTSCLFCFDGALKQKIHGTQDKENNEVIPSEEGWKTLAESGDVDEEDDVQDYVDSDDDADDEEMDSNASSSDESIAVSSGSDTDTEEETYKHNSKRQKHQQ